MKGDFATSTWEEMEEWAKEMEADRRELISKHPDPDMAEKHLMGMWPDQMHGAGWRHCSVCKDFPQ